MFSMAQAFVPTQATLIDVIKYKLVLRPNLKSGFVSGIETIDLIPLQDGQTIAFTANGLKIESATINGKTTAFYTQEKNLFFEAPFVLKKGHKVQLKLTYQGLPNRGITLVKDGLFTSYFACDWMVCQQDRPGDKAHFDLDLYVPEAIATVGIGKSLPVKSADQGLNLHRWRSERPYSAYLYAFAAARMQRYELEAPGYRYIVFDASEDHANIKDLFAYTPDIAKFFADKAGFKARNSPYVQILVPGSQAQETATFSLIGKAVLEDDFKQNDSQWVIAHEMAHQWWGNLVTCASWQDFWLNEGMATFMTAAWKQAQFGEKAYQAELDIARQRVKRAQAIGFDKPLAWDGAYPSIGTRRAIQYSKGALFLDYLRSELGEAAFWRGIAHYTKLYEGKTVRSQDFERSMSQASGRDLSAIFAKWVYVGEPQ